MTDHDLFGKPVHRVAKQLGLSLGMGVLIRWGNVTLTVSADACSGSMGAFPVDLPDLGARWAQALKVLYPGRKPGELDHKRCAADLGVQVKTAEGYGGGQEPRASVLWQALQVHGRRLLVLLAPELAPPTEFELLKAAEAVRETSAALADALGRIARKDGTP